MKIKLLNSVWTPLWSKITRGNEMRSLSESLTQYGRQNWETVLQKAGITKRLPLPRIPAVSRVQIQRVPVKVCRQTLSKQLFAGIFPRAAFQTLAAEWRRRAAVQMVSGGWFRNGRSIPLLAFVGLMVHAPKQDEKEELYERIRELHATKQAVEEGHFSLDCLELGKLIATGCNAAVYQARLTSTGESKIPQHHDHQPAEVQADDTYSDISIIDEEHAECDISESVCEELDASFFEENECDSHALDLDSEEERKPSIDDSEESLSFSIIEEEAISGIILDEDSLSDISIIEEDAESDDSFVNDPASESKGGNSLLDLNINLMQIDPGGPDTETDGTWETTLDEFDLAVKMMFNYDTESNAETIMQAMKKEVVPLTSAEDHLQTDQWLIGNHVKKKAWPPHPNIVRMYGLFVGAVPDIPHNREHYPAALPPRIFSEGLGRNMTLFLVMKRYSCTLSDYLARGNPSMVTRCFLLCQLLEGVTFLHQQSVAHRDLKSDNILLDLSGENELPRLVISDFGCCLNEGTLQIPYVTGEINKGGNSALMAPEIACAVAGWHSVLDYSKSDLWAVGALVYEIMGCPNPFYRSKARPARLDSRTYREQDLPSLPDAVPCVVKRLARNLLSRDPAQRLSAAVAATVMQLYIRSVYENNSSNNSNNNSVEELRDIQNWAVNNAARTILARLGGHANSNVPIDIKQAFLSRISHHDLERALNFVQTP